MSDMANLTRAVILVMGISIKMGNDLYAQCEYRKDKRNREQT
jgi:hypothetical protein